MEFLCLALFTYELDNSHTGFACALGFEIPRCHLKKTPPRDPLNYILSSVRKNLEEHLRLKVWKFD